MMRWPMAFSSAGVSFTRPFSMVASLRRPGGSSSGLLEWRGDGLSQQQSPAAHVTAADKLQREFEPLTERSHQHIHVLARSDAAQQHRIAPFTQFLSEVACVAFKRPAITRISMVDIHRRKRR